MSSKSFLHRSAAGSFVLAVAIASPSLFAQSSSSADYAVQASSAFQMPASLEYRTQYQNQYPSGGGGYHQYKGGDSTFSHIAIEGGVGFSIPVGTTPNTINDILGPPNNSGGDGNTLTVNPTNSNINSIGYNILLGGGYNFNKHFGAMLEYRFENLGINNAVLNDLYQYNAAVAAAATNGLTGNSHLWSFSLNPVYNFTLKPHWGGYATGGVGFYRDLTSFNTPVLEYYESYYGLIPEENNELLDHYSSNQFGYNVGGGVTWKPNPDQHGAIFADIRYEWVNTPGDATQTIPITFGYRW